MTRFPLLRGLLKVQGPKFRGACVRNRMPSALNFGTVLRWQFSCEATPEESNPDLRSKASSHAFWELPAHTWMSLDRLKHRLRSLGFPLSCRVHRFNCHVAVCNAHLALGTSSDLSAKRLRVVSFSSTRSPALLVLRI